MQEQVEELEEEAGDSFTLGDLWAILRMQKWVILSATIASLAGAAVWTATTTRYYSSRATVHLTMKQNLEMDMGETIGEGMNIWTRPTYLKTRVAILKSSSIRRRVLQDYEELGYNDGVKADAAGMALLSRAVRFIPRKGTELIDIVATTKDPEISARLANLMANVFRNENKAGAIAAAKDATEWTLTQLEDYDKQIVEASRELRAYQEEFDMADVEQGATSLSARMSSLKSAYGAANTERVQHETTVKMHEAMLQAGNYGALQKSLDDPLVSSIAEKYVEAVTSRIDVRSVYGPKMPQYEKADETVERLEQQLRLEIQRSLGAERATLQLFRDREIALEKAIDAGKAEMLVVQSRFDDYEKKKLDLDNAKEFYGKTRQRKAELELQSKTQLNNVRIVEEARPNRNPTTPNVKQNMLSGLLGGLILGLGLAFLREWLDDTISSPLDVKTYLRVRLLGIIPMVVDAEDEVDRSLYTAHNPNSHIAETMREIRTILELSPTGAAPKRIMVTSALSGEGKTSTTLRLAISFANLNRKVLVIDGDMRRPRIHKVFGTERVPGLATCILGDSAIDDAVRTTEIPNLFFLPSGKAYDRPNELLSSKEFEHLLSELDERFDMVFIDTPPSAILSDARLISRHVDGVLIVAKERATSRHIIRDAIRGLEQIGANVLGAIVNGVDMNRRASYYGYGYGYTYGGYAYGKGPDDDEQTESVPV